MTLNSFSFLVFFAGTLLLLWILKLLLQKSRHFPVILRIFLVIAGYLFIAYADIRYALCLFLFSLFTFFLGLLIRKYPEKKKPLMILGILVPLFFLGLFKYYNFFAGSFCRLIGRNYHSLGLLLPLGISFYTFSAIGYLIDLYRGKYSACTSFTEFLLYMGFFPKLISGPIMRFDDFKRELSGMLLLNPKDFEAGIQIFVIGMFKKMVLADHLNIFVNDVFSAPKAFHSLTVLWAVITYSLQIYFDFSGYSDMAIGSARMLGFHLPKNFNFPYLSSNLTEFWKRWHITLSSWLQEYVYYSLGGNRKGRVRTYLNLLLTMVIVFFMSKPISAYQLGETYAQNMGVNIKVFRILLILLSSILSACVTAFAGPISFVGIAVPHIAKSLLKTAKPLLVIPACFLGGAVFCLFCDLIARTVFAPTELSISSVTAVFGAPVVIYIMIRRQQRI